MPTTSSVMSQQASNDEQLIELWLHGKSPYTQRTYRKALDHLQQLSEVPLPQRTVRDLQLFVDSLAELSAGTRKTYVSAIKSLLSFGARVGYLRFNVGAVIRTPKSKNTLAERIMSEEVALRILATTTKPRDQALIRLIYASAGRVSEISQLKWRDCVSNGNSGQVTLYGKGGETRVVKLSQTTWHALLDIRPDDAGTNDPVFRSQKGNGHLDVSAIFRIVRNAGKRVGIDGVSPHWFRHAHASHALDRGASIALVRDTLGHSSVAITSRYLHAKPGESSALHLVV